MKRGLLFLGMCLLLTSCRSLPQPREMGDMALLRTVGIDGALGGVAMTVSTGQQAKGIQGEQQAAMSLAVEGSSLSDAALGAQRRSDQYIFFGYVDQLLLGETADLTSVLNWFATDEELSLGAQIWMVQDSTAREAVESGGEKGVDARLSTLRTDSTMGVAPMSRTAEEVYIALLERGCAFLPALKIVGEELSAGSYAVLTQQGLAGYLEEEAARGLELLAEKPMADILEVRLANHRVSLRITEAQVDCDPIFEGDTLTKLALTCRVRSEIAQQERTLSERERVLVQRAAEQQILQYITSTLDALRGWRADCIGLSSRVALAAPWHWNALSSSWPDWFAQVDIAANTEVALGIGRS